MDERIERAAPLSLPSHHSQSDWDFANVNWLLDENIYPTEAPSIRGTTPACVMLVKDATSGALSDGRVVSWVYADITSVLTVFFFRNQIADGGAAATNTYMIYIGETAILLYYYLNGKASLVESKGHTWSWAADTWYKVRVTWWSAGGSIFVRMERWNGDSWERLGGDADTDFADANDRWKDNAVNRIGISVCQNRWYDDLEVWG